MLTAKPMPTPFNRSVNTTASNRNNKWNKLVFPGLPHMLKHFGTCQLQTDHNKNSSQAGHWHFVKQSWY